MKKLNYFAPSTEQFTIVQQACLAESGTGEDLGDPYNMNNDDFNLIF